MWAALLARSARSSIHVNRGVSAFDLGGASYFREKLRANYGRKQWTINKEKQASRQNMMSSEA